MNTARGISMAFSSNMRLGGADRVEIKENSRRRMRIRGTWQRHLMASAHHAPAHGVRRRHKHDEEERGCWQRSCEKWRISI